MHLTLTEVFLYWIVGAGALSLWGRKWIASLAHAIPLPRILIYYLLLLPLVLAEEALTCEVSYLPCITVTLPAFALLFLILYGIDSIHDFSPISLSVLFGAMGWINEFIFVGRIHTYSLIQTLALSPLTFLIYFVLAIIPAYFLAHTRSRR